jgi:hypothetical protein
MKTSRLLRQVDSVVLIFVPCMMYLRLADSIDGGGHAAAQGDLEAASVSPEARHSRSLRNLQRRCQTR